MIINQTKLPGVFEINIEPKLDERGFFARCWCAEEFSKHGLQANVVQCSVSFNLKKGTLRGLHYQAEPHPETKLVRCTRGRIYDVVVDLRPKSPTYKKWIGVIVTAATHNMIYVPEACAHGFVTLEDETEVAYQMSEAYYPELARGVRWDDPAFEIEWPRKPNVISEKDRSYPAFSDVTV